MEMKMSGPGAGCKKRPPSRLQKHAPASLQLEQGAAAGAGTGAWGDGRAAIPLLSPLVVSSPTVPGWEAAEGATAARSEGGGDPAEGRSGGVELHQRGAVRRGGERQANDASTSPRPPPAPAVGAGWRHPALLTPVAEPASLVPMFQTHCGVEVRHAQQ
ncbi:hypothetical protein U9M48_006964 [Paspalum notatum var. saurae]|uniref:Uncharacterized protein n=1 Tax=Paspalum notatum var. saurae TaxID=547442 RepID=A0AAQ3PZ12_PASNO